MEIKSTTVRHSAWVGAMGWHNKKPLEYLALIASEVGEAVAEAPGNKVTPEFGSELVDIVLRVIDLAHMHDINLMAKFQCRVPGLADINGDTLTFSELAVLANQWTRAAGGSGLSVLEALAEVMPDLAKAMNDCRGATLPASLGGHLATVVLKVLSLARQQEVDVDTAIRTKIEKNAAKGNKGRLI